MPRATGASRRKGHISIEGAYTGPKATGASRAKKRYYRRRRGLQNLSLQVLPIVQFKKMRYADTATLSINNAFTAQKKYSLNGLYDPDITGGGHQPLGFDQMMALYNKYCVLGAKISIRMRAGSTANTYPMNLIGEKSLLSSLQYSSGSQPLEKPTCKLITQNTSASNVYNPEKNMKFWFSAKKQFRAKNRRDLTSVDHYNGDSSSNPDQQVFFYLTYQAQNLQQTTATLYIDVVLEYIAAFHDRKQLAQS